MESICGYHRGDIVSVELNGRRVNARVDKQVSPGIYQVTTEQVHTMQDGIQYNVFLAQVLPMLVITSTA